MLRATYNNRKIWVNTYSLYFVLERTVLVYEGGAVSSFVYRE